MDINPSDSSSARNSASERTPPWFVSLLSTGLDSPIATYLLMRKGWACHALSFLNGKDQAEINRKKVHKVGELLVSLTHQPLRLHFVNYDSILDILQQSGQKPEDRKQMCLLCKRTMLLAAKTLAQNTGAKYIVNGDILGEQASQTLDNLYVVNQINTEVPVLRPLIGFDKLDVIKLSQNLGFYEISLMKQVSCEYNPAFPETRANLPQILTLEKNIDRVALNHRIFTEILIDDIIEPK